MKQLAAILAAGLLFLIGTQNTNAQTPQADACQGLTILYAQNHDPGLVPVIARVAQDVGCLAVPANAIPVPVPVPVPYPNQAPANTYPGQYGLTQF